MVFITADHHFGHEKIIKCAGRPFNTVDEMNKELIERWNKVVKPTDLVYYLGDFTLDAYPYKYLRQLNGHVLFLDCSFHHDRWQRKYKNLLPAIYYLKYKKHKFVLSHFPLLEWQGKYHDVKHLHGHSHGNVIYNKVAFDVGVDCWNFYPVNIEIFL